CRHNDAVLVLLDGVGGTDQSASRLGAVHANSRHCRGCLAAVDIVDKYHRIALVCIAFATGTDTGAAADAPLRIDEHCLLHNFRLFTLLNFAQAAPLTSLS